MHYLRKFVGTYRVKADYDLSTNDFPRTETGALDPSFDDLYIDCKNNIKIRHGVGRILSCYIPSKGRGVNILRQIYQDHSKNKELPKETASTQKYSENLCSKLASEDILDTAEVLDGEVYFTFNVGMIDYIAELVGAKTNGKTISPFSSKNLPREPYKIPEEDMKIYKKSIENFPKKTMVVKGEERAIVDGLLIKSLNKEFDGILAKLQGENFDVDQDRKLKALKSKEYYHSFGSDIWQKYCDFLKESC